MKDSKTARREGGLNLSMNKRAQEPWRKASLDLSLRQLREVRTQDPTSVPFTELPATLLCCLPSTWPARSAPQLPVRQSASPNERRVLTLQWLTLPVKTLNPIPFPYSGS